MPLTARVGLACTITINTAGTELNFEDTTGAYNATTNADGYGMPGGIATTDVTQFKLALKWNSLAQTITYTFTVSANTITAATLTDLSGTAINIFSQLPSTVFPFVTANKFNLVQTWTNVTEVPAFDDDIYTLDYTASGTGSGTVFSYTTSAHEERIVDACCCVDKLGLEVSVDGCGCDDKATWNYLRGDMYLSLAGISANVGKSENSVKFLQKAQDVCDNSDCNC